MHVVYTKEALPHPKQSNTPNSSGSKYGSKRMGGKKRKKLGIRIQKNESRFRRNIGLAIGCS